MGASGTWSRPHNRVPREAGPETPPPSTLAPAFPSHITGPVPCATARVSGPPPAGWAGGEASSPQDQEEPTRASTGPRGPCSPLGNRFHLPRENSAPAVSSGPVQTAPQKPGCARGTGTGLTRGDRTSQRAPHAQAAHGTGERAARPSSQGSDCLSPALKPPGKGRKWCQRRVDARQT